MYYIRWATDKDIIKIADIEHTVYYDQGYDKKELSKIKSGKNTTIMVCDNNQGGINGYCIYNLSNEKIYVFRLVVDPAMHSQGIGGAFIQKLKDKLRPTRNTIELEVDDDNVVAHLFLKSHGFKCTQILWGVGDENDLYVFQYNGSVPAELP